MRPWPPLPAQLRSAVNADLVAYLERQRPSAHGDLVQELELALKGVASSALHCPDPAQFAYVVGFNLAGLVFALASGMQAIHVRLPEDRIAEALSEGATLAPELGPHWLRLEIFAGRLAASRARLAKWVAVAAG